MARAVPPSQSRRSGAPSRGSDARPQLGPVAMPGSLTVKWIAGRNGDFPVGDLHTAIGDFRVKDALLEQFDEGTYEGEFWISQIYAKSYEYRGRITIETRATLADVRIEDESPRGDEPDGPPEPDPIDETPPSAQIPAPAEVPPQPVQPADSDTDMSSRDRLLQLFGDELAEALFAGRSVKLDPTVDRATFREQRQCLKEDLDYAFDVKTQTWNPSGA